MEMLSIEEYADMQIFEESSFGNELQIGNSYYKKTGKSVTIRFNKEQITLPIYKEKAFGVDMNFPNPTNLIQVYIDKMPKSCYPGMILVNRSGIHLVYFDEGNTKAITIADKIK